MELSIFNYTLYWSGFFRSPSYLFQYFQPLKILFYPGSGALLTNPGYELFTLEKSRFGDSVPYSAPAGESEV